MHGFIARGLPQRWLEGIARYSDQSGQVKAISDWRKLLRAYLLNVILHAVIALAVILLCSEYLTPMVTDQEVSLFGAAPSGAHILAGLVTLIATLPSIWAIAIRRIQRAAYRKLWLNRKQLRGPLVALELLRLGVALALLALVVVLFFPSSWAFAVVPLSALVVLLVFRRRLQGFYQRVETHFLLNLNQREHREQRKLPELAPWDMHMAKVTVGVAPHAVGRTLSELALREKHGVNIALIERQDLAIPVPGRDERLLPGDELLVIGTDDQLAQLNTWLSEPAPEALDETFREEDMELLKFQVGARSPLAGLSIRESGMREEAHALVVGIEREQQRVLNPDSSVAFQKGDVVWIAGDGDRMRTFMSGGRGEAV
jgi:CPA2 family monovalent cation:H+ antiporter-2